MTDATPGDRYGPAVANPDQTLRLRRLVGLGLVVLGLVLIPSIVSQATQHRFGESSAVGHADCGTWADPSDLAGYRPALQSAGCAQAVGAASRTIALRASAAVLLLVAGGSLLVVGRVTRWIWLVALVALLAVIYAAAQPGGLAVPITTFLYGALLLVVVLAVLMRMRARRASEDESTPAA